MQDLDQFYFILYSHEFEQVAAMKYFGQKMEITPLPLSDMIHKITTCGTIQRNRVKTKKSEKSLRIVTELCKNDK